MLPKINLDSYSIAPLDEGDEDRDAGDEDENDEDADGAGSDLDLDLGEGSLDEGGFPLGPWGFDPGLRCFLNL